MHISDNIQCHDWKHVNTHWKQSTAISNSLILHPDCDCRSCEEFLAALYIFYSVYIFFNLLYCMYVCIIYVWWSACISFTTSVGQYSNFTVLLYKVWLCSNNKGLKLELKVFSYLLGLKSSLEEAQKRGEAEAVHVVDLWQVCDNKIHLASTLCKRQVGIPFLK